MIDLPAGLTHRPLTPDDAPAAHAVVAADHGAVLGRCAVTLEDLVADWADPDDELSTRSLGVLDAGRLVAYAELVGGDRVDAAVLPSHHGRGIGTALAGWLRDRARAAGATVIGMPVPEGSPADRLLAALGWEARWTSWELALPAGSDVPRRPLPQGHLVREAVTEADRRAAWTVLEDAFGEWTSRERETYERFCARTVGRPDAEPWHLRVLVDSSTDEVVGAVHVLSAGEEAEVARLAVRADRRGRGLAQALLADAYAVAREHGTTRGTLSTDSRTGALGLYLRVGMEVRATWVNRATRAGNGDASTTVASP